ncbi:hypothetical protein ACFWHF_14455 [Streptomyces griseoincarnatus]
MAPNVDVRMTGPMFDGRARAAARAYTRVASRELAREAEKRIRATLHQVLRHPTGYYESQIRVEQQGELRSIVTDGGVIYGPWLEGTGSRNRTTRFKGYRTFRRVRAQMEREAGPLAERALPPYLSRMR